MTTIGLVVPSIYEGGGVPAVARFLKDAISASNEFKLNIVSLATSARDEASVLLSRPSTWISGVQSTSGEWEGHPYRHIGASLAEIEYRRYLARRQLTEALADVDIIQIVSGAPAWAVATAALGKPTVIQVATRTAVERRRRQRIEKGPVAWWRWLMTRVTDRLDDKGLRAAQAVMVENPWMLRYACATAAASGAWVRYAPPGVDCSFFTPAAPRRLDSKPYILSVGRFDDPRKNVDALLDAYIQTRNIAPDGPRLQLAGAGDPGPSFWRRVRNSGLEGSVSFHLRPSREQLADYYRHAICLVLSSDEEGFGIVVVEAMASGIPVVATRCGGPDGIITDGKDGYLVPIGDRGRMAERIVKLAKDAGLNLQMGQIARQTAISTFAADIAAERYLETYRRLMLRRDTRIRLCAG